MTSNMSDDEIDAILQSFSQDQIDQSETFDFSSLTAKNLIQVTLPNNRVVEVRVTGLPSQLTEAEIKMIGEALTAQSAVFQSDQEAG